METYVLYEIIWSYLSKDHVPCFKPVRQITFPRGMEGWVDMPDMGSCLYTEMAYMSAVTTWWPIDVMPYLYTPKPLLYCIIKYHHLYTLKQRLTQVVVGILWKVGCGAIGCEMLKNYALLGLCTSTAGGKVGICSRHAVKVKWRHVQNVRF